MEITVKNFVAQFEKWVPRTLAEPSDPIGMQLGDPNQVIKKVLVTLDVRPEVVDEAVAMGANFIFAHHPLMFRPAKNLTLDNEQNKMYAKLLTNGIAVYAAHTNLDVVAGGMNDWLADALALTEIEVLAPTQVDYFEKISFRIKQKQLAKTLESFSALGLERIIYFPVDLFSTAEPQTDRAAVQVEVTLLHSQRQAFNELFVRLNLEMAQMPEITRLENQGEVLGLGRIGNLNEAISVEDFAQQCKDIFQVSGLRLVTADPQKMIQRVAVLGGDGGKFYPQALQKGADVYVTGDVYYHTAHDMLAEGLSVIDPGHHFEQICKTKLTEQFSLWSTTMNWSLEIKASKLNTDPFTFI